MSLCIVVADAQGEAGQGLQLLQVIEAIAYHERDEKAVILLDFLVHNERNANADLFLIHRGLTLLSNTSENLLSRSSSNGTDLSRSNVLRRIYHSRICQSRSSGMMGFRERVNCALWADRPTWIDSVGQDAVAIVPCLSVPEVPGFPPFSAYRAGPLSPNSKSWFRIELTVQGLTYDYLVKRHIRFWINGPAWALRQICEEDLPQRSFLQPQAYDFISSSVQGQVIEPKAYDVVVFRPDTSDVYGEVVCTPITGDVCQAPIRDESVRGKAYLYVTRSPRFWIDVAYSDILNRAVEGRECCERASGSARSLAGS